MNEPGPLAHRVDYRRLAGQNSRVEGEIRVAELDRLAAEDMQGSAATATVRAALDFEEDAQRRVRVTGRLATTLTLQCQRCLEPFDWPMAVEVAGVVVADDQAAADVPRADEPMLADGDRLDLHALVVDELLLALPPVARCEQPECRNRFEADDKDATKQQKSGREDDPFAALRHWRSGH